MLCRVKKHSETTRVKHLHSRLNNTFRQHGQKLGRHYLIFRLHWLKGPQLKPKFQYVSWQLYKARTKGYNHTRLIYRFDTWSSRQCFVHLKVTHWV